jgi:hypothetical protein
MQRQARSGGEQLIYMLDDLVLDLKKQNPDLLDALISTEVVIKKGDEEFENRTTILKLGNPNTIYWNFYRTKVNNSRLSKMLNDFFEFLELRRETEGIYRIRLDNGDCLINNDVRSLHARESFCVTEDGEMFKSWIRDMVEYSEVEKDSLVPIQKSFSLNFINKYRKK